MQVLAKEQRINIYLHGRLAGGRPPPPCLALEAAGCAMGTSSARALLMLQLTLHVSAAQPNAGRTAITKLGGASSTRPDPRC
jgi:hypothetical protein